MFKNCICLVVFLMILFQNTDAALGLKKGFKIPDGLTGKIRTISHDNCIYLWAMTNSTPSKFQGWKYENGEWHLLHELNECPYLTTNNDVYHNSVVYFNNSFWFTGSTNSDPTDIKYKAIEYKMTGEWVDHGFIWTTAMPWVYPDYNDPTCPNCNKMWFTKPSATPDNKLGLYTSSDGIQMTYKGELVSPNAHHPGMWGHNLFVGNSEFFNVSFFDHNIYRIDGYVWNTVDGIHGSWNMIFPEGKAISTASAFTYTDNKVFYLFADGTESNGYFWSWNNVEKKLEMDSKRWFRLRDFGLNGPTNPTTVSYDNKIYISPRMVSSESLYPEWNYFYQVCDAYKVIVKIKTLCDYLPDSREVKLYGSMIGDNTGIEKLVFKEYSNGVARYEIENVPEGDYILKILGGGCGIVCPPSYNFEVVNKDVVLEFNEVDRGPCISTIDYYPKNQDGSITLGNEITFSLPSTCGLEIKKYEWEFSDGYTSAEANPKRTFKDGPGNLEVYLKVEFCDGMIYPLVIKTYVRCPPEPPAPSVRMHLNSLKYSDDGQKYITIVDECPEIGTETVEVEADPIIKPCGSSVLSYKWFLGGVLLPSTEKKITVPVSNNKVIRVEITDGNNKRAEFERIFKLIPCVSTYNGKNTDIFIKHENKMVDGNTIAVIDDPRTTTIDILGKIVIDCYCRAVPPLTYTYKVYYKEADGYVQIPGGISGQLNSIGDENFTQQFSLITSKGYGKYKIELTTQFNGKSYVKERIISIGAPYPEVKCPEFGCGSTPELCEELYDALPAVSLSPDIDYSTGVSETVSALGGGVANKQGFGFWDEGKYKYLKMNGDFEIVVFVNNATLNLNGMEAGIMLRSGLQSFDKMLFLGIKNNQNAYNIVTGHRSYVKEDVAENYVKSGSATGDFLKIVRHNGIVSLYSSNSPTSWEDDPISILGKDQLSGFDGTIYAGIFAAGDNDNWYVGNVTFDVVRITVDEQILTKPATIINTKFPNGNLVSNWSFENLAPTVIQTGNGIQCNTRAETFFGKMPFEGRYSCYLSSKPSSSTIITKEFPCYYENAGQKADMAYITYKIISEKEFDCKIALIKKSRTDGTYTKEEDDIIRSQTIPAGVWFDYIAVVKLPDPSQYESFYVELIDQNIAISNVAIDNVLIYPLFNGDRYNPVTTMTFADAFDQKFQTITTQSGKDIVTALKIDDEGRVRRTLPEFVATENLHGVKTNVLGLVKDYYQQPRENYNWVYGNLSPSHGVIEYEASPLGREVANYSRIGSSSVLKEYSTDDGHVGDNLSHRSVQDIKTGFNLQNASYVFSTEYKNAFGYTTEKSSGNVVIPTNTVNKLTSTYDPDILGRNWKVTSPMGQAYNQADPNSIPPSTVVYNTLDAVIETNGPDKGKEESVFDKLGNQRFFRDAQKKLNKQFMVNMYDAFSRLQEVYIVTDNDGSRWNQANADDVNWPKNSIDFGQWSKRVLYCVYDQPRSSELPTGLTADMFKNTEGKKVAVYSFDPIDNSTVASYFSYDQDGQLETVWKDIPGLKLQKQTFKYNMAGQLVNKDVEGVMPSSDPAQETIVRKGEVYYYDDLGRMSHLSQITNGTAGTPERLVHYKYLPDGKMAYKDINNNLRIKFVYDALGRMANQTVEEYNPITHDWRASAIYSQDLVFNEEGNISQQDYYLPGVEKPYRRFEYTYDAYNRLLKSDFGSGTQNVTQIEMSDQKYDERMAYNPDGAITSMSRGSIGNGSYVYNSNSHRLNRITGAISLGGKNRGTIDNYVYDANGNIIEDKALRTRTEYDYRNLPVKVTSFSDAALTSIKTILRYIYDADGNRVIKIREK